LQIALPRLVERFHAKTGVAVSFQFGASGRLAEQIKQGAPFDVFLAANEAFVRDLAKASLIQAESVRAYARGSLVLAVYHELSDKVGTLADLTRPDVKKIALANPATAPYGRAGKQALERSGLWDRLQPKIVQADSVGQALLYAQKGDAEVAVAGRAIANVPEVRTVEIDPALYDPIVQALGIVAASPRTADAGNFAQFVMGEEGQAILREFGFKAAE
jgi:molybdate transport system substrate-binding protein